MQTSRYIDGRIEMKMQQIRAECNCKKMDYNYNFDSNEYYDD